MHTKPAVRTIKERFVTVVCYYPDTLEYLLKVVPYKGSIVDTMAQVMAMNTRSERVDFVCMLNGKCTVHKDWVPHVEGVV